MSRGRPRQYDPSIPDSIDQTKIPKGCYWEPRGRYWYARRTIRPLRVRLGTSDATLADLHTAMAAQAAGTGTFRWLHAEFQESAAWARLSNDTHRDYNNCLAVLARTKTAAGVFADLHPDRVGKVVLQRLVDRIAQKRPATANHVRRYLSRLYRWGMAHGRCVDRPNPAHRLEGAKERRQFKMPERPVMHTVIAFARSRGALKAHSKGSCPPYLWIFMSLAYRMRLRSVEVVTLTDAHDTAAGARASRRKGSLDNVTRWGDATADAWLAAWEYRDALWQRIGRPVPLKPEDRPLLVTEEGEPVSVEALRSAWTRFMAMAIEEGIITSAQRFTAHGLKHRGITDSDDKAAGGHKTEAMRQRYNHEVPEFDQAGE